MFSVFFFEKRNKKWKLTGLKVFYSLFFFGKWWCFLEMCIQTGKLEEQPELGQKKCIDQKSDQIGLVQFRVL